MKYYMGINHGDRYINTFLRFISIIFIDNRLLEKSHNFHYM